MKKLLMILLSCILMITGTVPVFAHTEVQERTADALNRLELLLGMGGDLGYMLDEELTRAQGLTLLIRVLGLEEEALNTSYSAPFTDVPEWARPYVECAYAHGITNGVSEDRFAPGAPLSDYMFLTMILRALGYRDDGVFPDFFWNDPYARAVESGLIPIAAADTEFTRGDAVEVVWNALKASMAGSDMTLAQQLILQDIFTSEAFAEAELIREFGVSISESAESEKNHNTIYPGFFPSWIFGWDDSDDDSEEEVEEDTEEKMTGGLIDEGEINLT